jgi:hypothetical protein
LRVGRAAILLAAAACVATGAVASCGQAKTHDIALTFRVQAGGNALSGFDCDQISFDPDAAGIPLALNALKRCGGSGRVSIAVDLIAFGGAPRCDTESMVEWCRSHTCALVPGSRVCVTRDLPDEVAPDAAKSALAGLVQSVKDQLLSTAPPDDFVVARAIASSATCDELLANPDYDCGPILGCAISCPTNLIDYSPDELGLALDLGPLDTVAAVGFQSFRLSRKIVCGVAVQLCAGTPFATPDLRFKFCEGGIDQPGRCE